MIVFIADGRLGNQIFQYAFLNTIAIKNEVIICFNMKSIVDVFDLKNKNFFQVSNTYATLFMKFIAVPFIIKPLITFCIISYIEQDRDIYLRPLPELKYKKGIFSFIRFVNTDFFQSEKLFNNEVITNTISIKHNFNNEASIFLSKIPNYYTKVFVHVRRGDYLNEVYMNERGIDLPKVYFDKALNVIKEEIKHPFFLFVSDDPLFVEQLFQDIEPKIISKNSMQVDMAIMSLCEAAIISNSSFSWWGAYLMKTRRIVIAPMYWYGWKQRLESHIDIQPKFSTVISF